MKKKYKVVKEARIGNIGAYFAGFFMEEVDFRSAGERSEIIAAEKKHFVLLK